MDPIPALLLVQLREHQYHGDPQLNPLNGIPPLCHAAAHCPHLVEPLLEAGADPNLTCEPDGRTPLMHAAWHLQDHESCTRRCCRMVDALLEAGTDVDACDRSGYTALGIALVAQNGHLATRLLAAGASVERGFPPGMDQSMLESAAKHLPFLLPLLVRAGCPIDQVDARGQGVFHWLVKYPALAKLPSNKSVRMMDWLVRHGGSVDARGKDGNTALHEIEEAHALMGQWLLRHGADCDARNVFGITPLMLAALKSPCLTRFFLTQGANPRLVSRKGVDALMASCTFITSLSEQISVANHRVGGALKGIAPEDWLHTPAHRLPCLPSLGSVRFPARLSCFNAVEDLLDMGADPTRVARDGSTALMRAARFQPESIPLLVAAGADIAACDRSGWTALMCASGSPRADLGVDALLCAGANPAEAFQKPQVEAEFKKNPAAMALLQSALLDGSSDKNATQGLRPRL